MIWKPILSLGVSCGLTLSAPALAATSATGETTAIPSSTNSINPAANKGKSSQSGGSAANMAMAAAMAAAAMMTQPPNMAMLMMAAMAAMQGGADKDAADQSSATAATTADTSTNPAANTATAAAKPSWAAAAEASATFEDQKKIKAGMAALNAAGYTATPAGISSAGGAMIPASAFNSSGSMLAAGLDPNAVKEAEKIGKDVGAKYAVGMSMSADGAGGAGGSGNNGSDAGDADKPLQLSAYKNPFALAPEKKAEMMAGKTVTLDGDPIGVKGDDIFQMVHAAYARKRAGNHFIETEHDPNLGAASVRVPASVATPLSPAINPLRK